jgi:hypothetical protein
MHRGLRGLRADLLSDPALDVDPRAPWVHLVTLRLQNRLRVLMGCADLLSLWCLAVPCGPTLPFVFALAWLGLLLGPFDQVDERLAEMR